MPLRLWTFYYASQPVKVSIRRGGGQCQDAPLARLGSMRWQRTVTTGPEPSARTTEETFTASFSEAPENQVPSSLPRTIDRLTSCPVRDPPVDGPRCLGTGLRGLSVGSLTLRGFPAGPFMVGPGSSVGEISYSATLPPGSLRPGSVQVEGTGGSQVGAFQASLTLPEPIEITTPLAPGTMIPADQPFRVTWTGGGPDVMVTMWLVSEDAPGTGMGCEVIVPASDGQLTLNPMPLSGPGSPLRLPVAARQTARVIVTVRPKQSATFSALGLARDGAYDWVYEYRFTGLQIRSP